MNYQVDDRALTAEAFLTFANQVWPGDYDVERTRTALAKTLNLTAYDGGQLVGCLRILSDGYFFGTITELLVLPSYQRRGIGSRLLRLARAPTPPLLSSAPSRGAEPFYKKNGCQRSLAAFALRPEDGGA